MVRRRQSNALNRGGGDGDRNRGGGDGDGVVLDATIGSYEDFANGINPPARTPSEEGTPQDQSWVDIMASVSKTLMFYATIVLFALLIVLAAKIYFAPNKANVGTTSTKEAKTSSLPAGVLSKGEVEGDKPQWQAYLKKGLGAFKVLTDEEIKYKEGGKLYLVIAGVIFDVTMGGKTYEKGSGYHGFIGQDGTRAFVTGKFDEEGLVPDIEGLEADELLGISKWIDFYLNSEKYKFVGLHKGTFFDINGMPTNKMRKFLQDVLKAKAEKLVEEQKDRLFPSCNMEWSQATGSRMWCSEKSGGIERSWAGWPRIFKEEGKGPRCACVKKEFLGDTRLELYANCPEDSIECHFKE